MKYILGIFAILIVAICFSGCCATSSQTSAQEQPTAQEQTQIVTEKVASRATAAVTSAVTTTVSTVATSSTPIRITGNGDDVIAFSASGTALRVFSMQHTGDSNFAIWLIDDQGNNEDLLVNEIGSYSGKKSAKLTSGDYSLDVTADGPWAVEISPSVSQIQPTSGKSPLVFRGSGDDVVSFSSTGTGLRIFTMTHTGDSNFAVWLKDGDGDNIDLLVNEIGSYSGKKSAKLTTGDYVLDISADGPWTAEVAS